MNFDERLRSQLRAQSDELSVTPEGVDGVRARSHRRRQQRAGGATLATIAVALLIGGWFIGRSGDDSIQVATDGETNEQAASADGVTTIVTNTDEEIEVALPEPGTALTLTSANNENAPGGYNVYQTGRTNGLYFVVSTAPGVTWEDNPEGFEFRADTFYTFDGSSWSNSKVGDRYVSSFDSGPNGVLYAVSTGSPTTQALEVGTSTNGGRDWEWTEIDLKSVFGEDPATWPPYSVQYAERGDERLLVVHTTGNIDWDEATTLAIDNGADIDRSTDEIVNVDRNGIAWIEDAAGFEQTPCQRAYDEAMSAYWETEGSEPEVDFVEDRPATEAEREQVRAADEAARDRYWAAEAEALQSVARVPGCETFVKCNTEMNARSAQINDDVSELFVEMGIDVYSFGFEVTEEQNARIEALYAEHEGSLREWVVESGCEEIFPYFAVSEEEAMAAEQYATWESLGVAPPEAWNGINRAFVVDGASITDLGDLFVGQAGYLIEVDTNGDRWSVSFDSSTYSDDFEQTDQEYTTWTSTDGDAWTSETTTTFDWNETEALANGTSLSVNWTEAGTELLRRGPDGSASRLTLADLTPDLDTSRYELVGIQTGEYGAIAWAVDWPEFNEETGESIGNYQSIVLYSPDGVGWGVTEVPDVEVVTVVIGNENALIFLNDPNRAEGTPQPIMLATAE